MMGRLRSAAAILLVLFLVTALDIRLQTAAFSLLLIAALLAAAVLECRALVAAGLQCNGRPATLAGTWAIALALVLIPGAFLVALRLDDRGLVRVLVAAATAKMTDNGALFIGRAWGRRPLVPRISPAKTIAGFWGGLAVGAFTAVLLLPLALDRPWPFALLFGALVSLFAALGDLAESRLKRFSSARDSGSLFPGIGGFLDLLDSVLLAAPAAYLLFHAWQG